MRKIRLITKIARSAALAALGTGIIALLGPLPSNRAAADATTYTTTKRQIRAAILTSSAINVQGAPGKISPENPDPHVFYVLDSRTDLKPLGMDFVNPLAPPVITSTIYQRWADRVRAGFVDPAFGVNTAQSQIFRIGAPITKNMGAYWELNLDSASDEDLRQYDLLYLHSHRQKAIFSPELKEKLRKFIEAGGTLWVENCGSFTFDSQNPFLYDVSMQADYTLPGNASAVVANANHPLLSYPFVLAAREVQNLGDKFRSDPNSGGRFLLSGYYLYAAKDPADPAPGLPAVNPPGGQTLVPIVWNSLGIAAVNASTPPAAWRPLILAGQVGAGHILFASQDSGCTINDYVGGSSAGYGGNSAAISGDVLAGASPTDMKFCYNLAAWTGAHTTSQTDTRHSSGTAERIAGALTEKWPVPPSAGAARSGGATLFKHCIYSVDGNLILHCYDAKPGQDLDGDNNPDDGLPDAIYGLPYDEIWNFDLTSVAPGAIGASTPTCYEFYDPGSTGVSGGLQNFPNREQVVVVMSNGVVVALRALPRLAVNGFPLAPIGVQYAGPPNPNPMIVDWVLNTGSVTGLIDYPAPVSPTTQVPAATWSEGVLFVAVNSNSGGSVSGRVVAIDPRGMGNGGAKSAFNPSAGLGPSGLDSQVPIQPGTPPFVGAPTIGYVRDNALGVLDKMIYVHTDRPSSGSPAPQSLRAIPFGSKGEQLTRQALSNNFISRSTGTLPPVPWFRADPSAPGTASLALGQRVYATYTDPANGNFYATELKFTGMAAAAPGPNNEYAAPKPVAGNQPQVVIVSNSLTFPPNGANSLPGPILLTDIVLSPNVKIFADYTLDWTLNNTNDPTLNKAGVRTVLSVPDINNSGNLLGGPPALAADDTLYYAVDTSGTAGGNEGRGVVFAVAEQAAARTILRWTYSMHNGFPLKLNNGTTLQVPPRLRQLDQATQIATGSTIGTYITDVQFIGSPAVRKDVVYAVGRANIGTQVASVLCAFRANQEFVLHLNTPIDKSQIVTVYQINPIKRQNGSGGKEQIVVAASGQPGVRGGAPLTVDYDSGTIRINAMANPGPVTNFFSASLPFVVQVGTQEKIVSGTQIDVIGGGEQGRTIGAPGVDNLLWYAVIPANSLALNSPFGSPGLVYSSPSVQGDTIFLGTYQDQGPIQVRGGYILAIDADPGANDPAAQKSGAQIELVTPIGQLNHLRWVQRVGSAPVLSAPVASENVLAVNSPNGTHAYEDAFTIIADSNRLIEVNSAGEAVWTCDGTRTFGAAGGDIAQFINNGQQINPQASTGVPVVHKIPFARPAVARRIGTNDFLVVDTGNNRVVEIDRGGNIVWEVHRLFDDMLGLLRPGDPLALNEPSDCAYATEYTPSLNGWFAANGMPYTYNNLPGFIVHYLITDTGNFRVIELVDVYNSAGQPVRPSVGGNPTSFTLLRQLYFASSTFGTQGKRYRYRGVQRSVQLNGTLKGTAFYDANKADTALRRFTLAAITNYRLGSGSTVANNTADAEIGGGGSIVVMDESGAPISSVTNLAIPTGATSYRLQPINNPTSFSKFDIYDVNTKKAVFHYLLSDANGCYQLRSGLDANNNPIMVVEWILSNDDYFSMTGKRLNATSIRRLNTAVVDPAMPGFGLHRFLIANRFSGGDLIPAVFGITQNVPKGSEFNGEVFEIDPSTYNPLIVNGHGYIRDYSINGANFLVANNSLNGTPQASIIWRSPSELVPNFVAGSPQNINGVVARFIGSPDRATSTSTLEKPSYADRPF